VNVYFQSQTLLNIKRAYRWFPLIEEILKKNGIPDDFKYVAMIESGFMNVVSPSEAHGFWQFLKETGIKYSLEINEKVDERYNVAKATQAACDYFNEAYKVFNNWTLVAASYNMGIGGVRSQINKQQVNSFYDLLLNSETSRYIFRILSVKEIYDNPLKYGFHFSKRHLYKPYSTYEVTIDTSIENLITFAKQYSITYRTLKILNPWLRNSDLPNKTRKQYVILLPKAPEELANKKVREEENEIPAIIIKESIVKDSLVIHRVKKKETLKSISDIYGVTSDEIKEWNTLLNEKITKGQELKIYQFRKSK
jgi:LysM repeat protein